MWEDSDRLCDGFTRGLSGLLQLLPARARLDLMVMILMVRDDADADVDVGQ